MKTLLMSLMFLSSLNFAQTHSQNVAPSTGGGNGGQTIYKGKVAYLRDIVEKNNCIWKKYDQIINENPVLSSNLYKIKLLNSSFGLRIEEEIMQLGYCFTTKRLPYLQYNNSDDIHIFANQEYDQVAINDSGIVFIDLNIFNAMDGTNRAYLFLHEAAHELFDKDESRSSREPRLREFLMNLFQQLETFAKNKKYSSFDYMIEQANFTALEQVTKLDLESFKVVYLNENNVSLSEKVKALKKLEVKETLIGRVFSEVLLASIEDIEKSRLLKLDELLNGVLYRTTEENFSNLVRVHKEASKYIYNDENKLAQLNETIMSIIEEHKLFDSVDELTYILNYITANTVNYNWAGYVGKNYDAVFGEGFYANVLLKKEDYLDLIIFGKEYRIRSNEKYRYSGCSGSGGQVQCSSSRYIGKEVFYVGYNVLSNNEKGLLFLGNTIKDETIGSYLLKEAKYNSVLKEKVISILEKDIRELQGNSTSLYFLPSKTMIGDKIRKKGKALSSARFSVREKNKQIRLRKNLIEKMRNL